MASSSQPQYVTLNARITDYEIIDPDDGKKFTNFNIVVKLNESQWTVSKRFTEFKELKQRIKRAHSNIIKTRFSSKLLSLTHLGDNLNPNFINQRITILNDFLREMLANQTTINMTVFHQFLNIPPYKIQDKVLTGSEAETSAQAASQSSQSIATSDDKDEILESMPNDRPKATAADFEFLAQIGRGGFGRVYQARHKQENKMYAIKVLSKQEIVKRNHVENIWTERNVLSQNFEHPFLVAAHYSFHTKDKLYLVLDFVNGGEMFTHLKNERTFPEKRARFYAAEIGHAIGYLHSKNIIYRDLKSENILFDREGHIKLTDFGLCKEGVEYGKQVTGFMGTPDYLAPEIILSKPYSFGVDWWTFGCVLYEMLFGWPPFYDSNQDVMYQKICWKPLQFKFNISISQEAKNILTELLQKDPQYRLGSNDADFAEIRDHAFFASINWDDLVNKRLPVPWIPKLDTEHDLKHIDPEFTSEEISSSVIESVARSMKHSSSPFDKFTYQAPSNLI